MAILKKLQQYFSHYLFKSGDIEPEKAYDLWAGSYDSQPDNLMLALDEVIFNDLIAGISLKNSVISDVGCGTGRHWKKILSGEPKKLIGFDVSAEMLKMLKLKFPQAETYRLKNNKLLQLQDQSCDHIVSTLTIAHIKNAEVAIAEWSRVLKPGGHMIITDYHPVALAKGGKRTFRQNDHTVAVKNYIHTLEALRRITNQLGLEEERLIEKKVDDSSKNYYEKQNALRTFEIWKGVPIIYGMHLKKTDATS